MKKIFMIGICSLLLIVGGCSSSKKYVRDTSPGKITNITKEEWEKKLANKESFTLMFSQPSCGSCISFNKLLNEYIKDHNIEMFDYSIDTANLARPEVDALLAEIRVNFPDVNSTPDVFYIKDGKIAGKYEIAENEEYSIESIEKFVVQYQLDDKK